MIRIVIALPLAVLAVINDIKTFKIKNSLTLSFAILGFITNFILFGKEGLKDSLLGFVLPIIVLFLFFTLKMLGAGDIKLFSAFGSILGVKGVIDVMLYSFFAGGIIAFILILVRRNGLVRLKYFYRYILACFLTRSILSYGDLDKKDNGRFRFAYAIMMGLILTLITNY